MDYRNKRADKCIVVLLWKLILAPIFLTAILSISNVFVLFGFASWLGAATLFQIIYVGRLFSLNIGPFPEIVYNLNLFSSYSRLLLSKLLFSFITLSMLFYLNSELAVVGFSLMALNVIPNALILFKIRTNLQIKRPLVLWNFDPK